MIFSWIKFKIREWLGVNTINSTVDIQTQMLDFKIKKIESKVEDIETGLMTLRDIVAQQQALKVDRDRIISDINMSSEDEKICIEKIQSNTIN